MVEINNKDIVMYLVSHTHWDREWYLPFEGFRFRLVKCIDKLLGILDSDETFRNFMLDGQAVVLEDYLAVRPENREKIITYLKDERISAGPFYMLPDEFLISPESHIRNLLLGHRVVNQLAENTVMKAGYMPDSFGHIAQMPQILKGFDIDTFFFTRGMGDQVKELGMEFEWVSQDGKSSVLTINFPMGYCAGANLTRDQKDFNHATARLKIIRDKLKSRAKTNILLVPNGCDHLTPEQDIPNFVEHFNKLNGGSEGTIKHAPLQDYIDAIKARIPPLKKHVGDFRWGKEHLILSDIFSSRVYLILRYFELASLLERWTEPLNTVACIVANDVFKYPTDYLWHAWRYLLKNGPHDSIGGCSVDDVHQDMMARFHRSEQICNVLIKDAFRHVIPRINFHAGQNEPKKKPGTFELIVVNPSAIERAGPVSFWIAMFDINEPECPEIFKIFDPDGNECPIEGGAAAEPPVPPSRLLKNACYYRFSFFATGVPAFGFKTYYLTAVDDDDYIRGRTDWIRLDLNNARVIETQFHEIKVNENGTLKVHDKVRNKDYNDWCLFIDEPDFGDEYDFIPMPSGHEVLTSRGSRSKVSLHELTGDHADLLIKTGIKVHAGLKPDRSGLLDDFVEIPIEILMRLHRSRARIDFLVRVENRAKDHRLRVAFPSGINTDHVLVGQHFTVIKRPIKRPDDTGWVQKQSTTDHFLKYISLVGTKGNDRQGIILISKGMQEYEISEEEHGINTMILTLLRCVGWLGRPEGGAGPALPTPDAQCQGKYSFEFALEPFDPLVVDDGELSIPDDVFASVDDFLEPLKAIFPNNYEDFHNTTPLPAILDYGVFSQKSMRLVRENNEDFLNKEKVLGSTTSILELKPASMIFSTFKKAEKENRYILRFYNASRKTQDATITFHPIIDVSKLQEVKLNEEPVESSHEIIATKENTVVVKNINHDEIITLMI
ncbi:MAG: glycosyl hydrolase-related protein [Promethearchaeota archaeon]